MPAAIEQELEQWLPGIQVWPPGPVPYGWGVPGFVPHGEAFVPGIVKKRPHLLRLTNQLAPNNFIIRLKPTCYKEIIFEWNSALLLHLLFGLLTEKW